MIEKPNLPDEQILACLSDRYHIRAAQVDFLPLGNDSSAWVYRVTARDGTGYFLKVKRGSIYEPALSVPRFLNDKGIHQVVAPLGAEQGQLWQTVGAYHLILYPFIDGNTGMEIGMSDEQWQTFGNVLKKIHQTQLPPQLAAQVQRERFLPIWAPVVRDLQGKITRGEYASSQENELAAFWKTKSAEIQAIVERTEALGQMLQIRPGEFVLSHSDIHTANLLIDAQGDLHIVDWDQPIFAPKERDLMFVTETAGSSVSFTGREPRMFFAGYGETDIDPLALSYYQYEWVVQEIGDYGERVYLLTDVGEGTRQAAVDGFRQLFQQGDVIETAYRSDQK